MSNGTPRSIFTVENITRKRVLAGRIQSARNSADRRRGLLGLKELDSDSGLWINPCEAVHTFGMQMVLDVIFLDADLRVKKIAAHLRPNRIAFCLAADSVLEVKAGAAAASGTKRGDQLQLHNHGGQYTAG